MFERDGSADKPAISHRRAAPLDVSYGEHRHQTRPSPVFDFLRPARVSLACCEQMSVTIQQIS